MPGNRATRHNVSSDTEPNPRISEPIAFLGGIIERADKKLHRSVGHGERRLWRRVHALYKHASKPLTAVEWDYVTPITSFHRAFLRVRRTSFHLP
jgi:hypothetical protein